MEANSFFMHRSLYHSGKSPRCFLEAGWADIKAGLGCCNEEKNPCPSRESNTSFAARSVCITSEPMYIRPQSHLHISFLSIILPSVTRSAGWFIQCSDKTGESGLDFSKVSRSLSVTVCRPTSELSDPPIEWASGALSPGGKWCSQPVTSI
jgi:hypothetical protein